MTPTDHEALVSLRDYVDTRIMAIEKGIDIAHRAMEIRLAGMNEIREQLREQAEHFATKDAVDYNEKRLTIIENQLANIVGANTGKWQIAIIAGATVVTAAVTLIHMVLTK